MAVIKDLQKVLEETRNVQVSYYYSAKDSIWNGYILKTGFHFTDPDMWTMLEKIISHIKANREYNERKGIYKYKNNA